MKILYKDLKNTDRNCTTCNRRINCQMALIEKDYKKYFGLSILELSKQCIMYQEGISYIQCEITDEDKIKKIIEIIEE